MWGLKEAQALTSVVKATTGSATLTGATGPNMLAGSTGPTQFTSELQAGDTIQFQLAGATGVFVIKSIESNTSLTLTETVTGATGIYRTAIVAQKPKYLSDTEKKTSVYGVDTTEAALKGIHPGWVKVTDRGNGRTKYETLVATTGISDDAEDTVFPDA